jgi:hypothetical protein
MDGAASLPPRHGDGLICPLPLALRRLADRPHWVIWRWTDPVPGRKPDKPLYRAADPWRHASTQDPASWDSFAAAMGAIAAGEADGAGYVLRDDPDHLFLDLDGCRDPASGALADWAERLVEEADSYTEVTPSGRGLRIIGTNESLSAPIHRRIAMPEGGSVEIFHRCPRYVTVSGQRLAATPDRLRPICDLAADLLLLAKPDTRDASQPPGSAPPRHNPDAAARPEDIAAALAGIPNPDLPWEEWSRIGMAVWRASGGSPEGLAAWRAWSAKSGKHRDAACDERWRHWFRSPPGRIGFGSLHHMAQQANPLWVKPSLLSPLFPAAARQTDAEALSADWEGDGRPPASTRPSGAQNPPTASLVATPFDPADLATLGPREWVYGQFLIRRFVSVLGAPGGTGKTAYAVAVALSVAIGRPLVEEPVHSPGPVWLYNLEDPRDELLRRVQAALIAHDIPPGDLRGRLYLDSGREQPLILATRLPDGSTVATPLVEALIAELTRRQVRLLIVDPFVKSHRLEENRNEQLDFAATLWSRVADAAGCAILLVHHFRKGGIAGDADAFRGASALIDAARAAVALRTMSEEEAERFGIDEAERSFFVRADNAKLNLAPRPRDALWLRLNSISLPSGDHVQAMSRWRPASAFQQLSMAASADLIEQLGTPREDGERWSARRQDSGRWAGTLITSLLGCTEEQARTILDGYLKSQALRIVDYQSPKQRKERKGLEHDPQIVAAMRLQAQEDDDE